MSGPASTRDLAGSERRFIAAMTELGYGRFKALRIEHGELVLDPWPPSVRDVKFASQSPKTPLTPPEFTLKPQVSEFFDHVRSVGCGEIRTLEVKCGLPFSMQIETDGGRRDG